MTPTQRERAAQLIVEAATEGDKVVTERHGVSVRTLMRHRARLNSDSELARLVSDKKAKVEQGWADKIPGALRACIAFLEKAADQGDERDPAAVHAIAGAMKLLSETAATWKVLDKRLARLAGQDRPIQSEARPDAPGRDGGAHQNGARDGNGAGADLRH